ncbi:hypothetical protein JOC94_002489 [Bacillus thermophilus]|uniref:Uncharacterized protein n=1 Tax=Siminovitchia thermophila TaxID=1245522 RepID=A0ABS2RA54_9BACI|nr:hypothetical protein [Siminovitchia thermophila]
MELSTKIDEKSACPKLPIEKEKLHVDADELIDEEKAEA